MFLKAKYTALVLFSALTFRILLLNIPYIVSLMTIPARAKAVTVEKHSYKRKFMEYAQYDAKTDIQVFDVSEESIEDDTDECFEKGAKYPSQLIDVAPAFQKVSRNVGLPGLAENFRTKRNSRTYLSISVLRI